MQFLLYSPIIPPVTYKEEIARKLVHLASATIPLVYCYASRDFMLVALGILSAVALGIEFFRATRAGARAFIDRWLGRIIRTAESATMTGATYVVLGGLLAIFLFEKRIAIAVLLFLSISDALASLVGIKFGRVKLLGKKSLAGSLAFFLSAAAIVSFVQPSAWWIGLLGAFTATIVEALPLKIAGYKLDDNLTIPLIAGAVMTGLMRWCT